MLDRNTWNYLTSFQQLNFNNLFKNKAKTIRLQIIYIYIYIYIDR